jgi:hypothetical protein
VNVSLSREGRDMITGLVLEEKRNGGRERKRRRKGRKKRPWR